MTVTEKCRCVNEAPRPNSAAKNDRIFCEYKMIRVYCYHATPLMLAGITYQLKQSPCIDVIGKASSSDDLLLDLKNMEHDEWPDVIILDTDAKPTNSMTTYINISLMKPRSTEIMVLDSHSHLKYAIEFFRLRARHYVQASNDIDLVKMTQRIASGERTVHISETGKKTALDCFCWLLQGGGL